MKRILLILALIFMIILPVLSQTGNYTTNEYFYLPEYGSYGTDEYDEYNDYMQIADDQIEANKVMGEASVDTSGTPADNDIAVFIDSNTVEGLDYAELKEVLNLEIGTDVQAYDAGLLSIAALTTAANKSIYTTGLDTYAVYTLSSAGRDLIDDADASAQRTTLGLVIGTNVEAHDDGLLSIAGLSTIGGSVLYTTALDNYSVVAPNTTTVTKFLRMVGTGSAYQAPTWESINPQQVVSVAKAGGDYTTVQGAIDSISDNTTNKRYIIIISPGTYTEDITMEDFVSLEGMGKRSNVVINGTVTFATDAGDVSGLRNLTVSKTLTADLAALIISASQTHIIRDCTISLSSSTNGVKATMFDINAGTFRLEESTVNLTFTGSTGTDAEITIIFDIEAATSIITDNKFDIDIGDIDDIIILFDESGVAVTEILFDYNTVEININNINSTGAAGIAYLQGTGTNNNFAYNHLHIASTGNGTGYAYYSNGTANSTIHSNSNRIIIEGFTNNYFYYVSSGDTLTSHFDDVVAATTSVSAGTVYIVSSLADGSFWISSTQYVDTIEEYTSGTGVTIDSVSLKDGNVSAVKTIEFEGVYAIGNSGSTETVDWQNGAYQSITLDEACVISFNNEYVGILNLRVTYGGSFALTFDGGITLLEEGGVEIVTTDATGVDELMFKNWGTADTYTMGALLDVKD